MPRQDTYRVSSDNIQGKGSFVEFRAITRTEWKAFVAADVTETDQLLGQYITNWNWKDRDGNALAQPRPADSDADRGGQVEGLDALTTIEYQFLINAVVRPPVPN